MLYSWHMPDIYQTYDNLWRMSGICLACVWHMKHGVVCQTYARHVSVLRLFMNSIKLLWCCWNCPRTGKCLAYPFRVFDAYAWYMSVICISISNPASSALQLNRDWVAAEHGFWARVLDDKCNTQSSKEQHPPKRRMRMLFYHSDQKYDILWVFRTLNFYELM